MRELKFRVWDEMLKSYSTDLRCNVMEFFDSPDGNIQYGCVDIAKAFANPPDGQVIEQFTGLRDKNGREIYEGDIVSTVLNTGDYRADNFLVSDCGGYWFPLIQVQEGYNCIDRYRPEDFEVIGNIHENPELLD